MDEVCGEPKLVGWKSTGCKGFSKAILDAMSADVLSNRERLSAKAVCHSFWLKFLAQESELFELELKEREEESRRKVAERAEAMKQAAEEAAQRAEEAAKRAAEEAKAEDERRRKEDEARRETEEKRAAEEEATRQAAKEAKATSAKQVMEEAWFLTNASALATWAPENASVSSPQEVLAASAEALAAS